MTFQEDLSPLANGEDAANNLTQTLATEPRIHPNDRGINHDLAVQTVLQTFDQITSARKNRKWICFREWLQREEQVKKWKSSKKRAARSYLQGVFQSWGVTEEFLLCDIDFLIRDIERQKKVQPKMKKLWNKMLSFLKKSRDMGAEYVILDGQNRINHALVPFRYDGLRIPLRYNGYEVDDVAYADLDDFTKEQINQRQFRVSIIMNGDVTRVVDKLININDGEPWGDHERRDVLWTSVSFDIKSIASYPNTVKLHTNTLKHIWTGSYALHKKGVTLFIAEMLHYIRNEGSLGTSSSLTKMYKAVDENIEDQLELLNDLFKLVANNFPKAHASKKGFTKELYRNIYLYLLMLVSPPVSSDIKNDLSHKFKLSQIKNPQLLLDRIILAHKKMYADRSQIIPFKRGTNTQLSKEQVEEMTNRGDDGLIVWSNTNARPGTYIHHHNGSSKNDLSSRINLFFPKLQEIVDDCLEDGTLTTRKARSISTNTQISAEVKYFMEQQLPDQEELKTVIDKELDHEISVKMGGDCNLGNLNYIDKEDNRRKGAN